MLIIDDWFMYSDSTNLPEKKGHKSSTKNHKRLLEETIADKGTVTSVFGGFEIIVHDSINFPWSHAFIILLELKHEVWITKEENSLTINTKPSPYR